MALVMIMEEEVDMMGRRRTRLFILTTRQDPLESLDGDPNPDGPHDRHSRMYQSMTINKWAKPIPRAGSTSTHSYPEGEQD